MFIYIYIYLYLFIFIYLFMFIYFYLFSYLYLFIFINLYLLIYFLFIYFYLFIFIYLFIFPVWLVVLAWLRKSGVSCRVVSFSNFHYSDTTRLVANLSADTTDHLNMSRWSDASDFPVTSSRGRSKVGDKSVTSS